MLRSYGWRSIESSCSTSVVRLYFVFGNNIILLQNIKTDSPSHPTTTNDAMNNSSQIANELKQISINSSSSDGMTTSSAEQQLKYENERLKLALAQR